MQSLQIQLAHIEVKYFLDFNIRNSFVTKYVFLIMFEFQWTVKTSRQRLLGIRPIIYSYFEMLDARIVKILLFCWADNLLIKYLSIFVWPLHKNRENVLFVRYRPCCAFRFHQISSYPVFHSFPLCTTRSRKLQ